MNAYATTAHGISEVLTGVRSRRTEFGRVVASSHHADPPARYVVSVRGNWFICKQSEKDSLLFDGDTTGLTPLTDDECDAVDRGDW